MGEPAPSGGFSSSGRGVRLAFVIQRYGLEVNGGAEMHCRLLAERLARRHQVEVFATRALDYLEWRNHYPEGTALVNQLPVHRFTVKRRRNARVFASLSNVVFHDHHTRTEEEAWVRENGPFSPDLVRAVERARGRFDLFLFYCYRYYHSWAGLPGVGEKGVLVPTAEDDPAIHLGIFKPFFRSPRGIVYLTPEEQQLVEGVSGNEAVPSAVIGSGLDLPEPDPSLDFAKRHGLERPFILYVGRIDRMKGCLTLFAYFKKFLEDTGLDVDLVLAGKAAVPVPDHPRIRRRGLHHGGGEGGGAPSVPSSRDAFALREPVRDHPRGVEARGAGARQREVPGPRGAVPAEQRRSSSTKATPSSRKVSSSC